MKKISLIFLLAVGSIVASAQQQIDSLLAAIERNNLKLTAIRKNTDAEKIGNKTGIYWSDPEVEFNYLWGSPSPIGNRTDFSIKQSFDFPTAYSYRGQISILKNEQAELEYAKQRLDILLRARLLCAELIYVNAMQAEFNKRKDHAERLATTYKAKFDAGEVSILELNKARVNLLNISKECESIIIERNALLSELATLNGGMAIDFSNSAFSTEPIDPDFEKWYDLAKLHNPVLVWLKQEIEIGQKQEKLAIAMNLPKLGAGFMSERVVGEQYQGITAGISIPLWENKNTVKYARAKTEAIQGLETDAVLAFYNEMKTLHTKAIGLAQNVAGYRQSLDQFSNSELLQMAFDKGEISLGEYLFELSVNYNSWDQLLEMEKELAHTLAQLMVYQ